MADSNPFIYSNAILDNKQNLIVDDETEKAYIPFLTNRALSQHQDLLAIANKVNELHLLDKKLQFDYLLHVVPKRKRRFVKWPKREQITPEQQIISEYYSVNINVAREYEKLLTKEQMKFIMKTMNKGGL